VGRKLGEGDGALVVDGRGGETAAAHWHPDARSALRPPRVTPATHRLPNLDEQP